MHSLENLKSSEGLADSQLSLQSHTGACSQRWQSEPRFELRLANSVNIDYESYCMHGKEEKYISKKDNVHDVI